MLQSTILTTAGTLLGAALFFVAPGIYSKMAPPAPWVEFRNVSVVENGDRFDVIYSVLKRRDCHASVDTIFITTAGQDLREGRYIGPASLNHVRSGPDAHVFTISLKRPDGFAGEPLGYRATVTPDDPSCGAPVTADDAWLPGGQRG